MGVGSYRRGIRTFLLRLYSSPQAGWAVISIVTRMIFGTKYNNPLFDAVTLVLEVINYAFFLMIVEGMAFTIRKGGRYTYCVATDGGHLYSAECNAIYATIAFAGADLLLSFIAAIGITIVMQRDFYVKYKSWRSAQRIQSPGNPASESVGI